MHVRAPWPSHLFVYLFPNLPALSFNGFFLTQARTSQLGSVLGGIRQLWHLHSPGLVASVEWGQLG